MIHLFVFLLGAAAIATGVFVIIVLARLWNKYVKYSFEDVFLVILLLVFAAIVCYFAGTLLLEIGGVDVIE